MEKNISNINELLFYRVWRKKALDKEQKKIIKKVLNNNYKVLYGRKIYKEIINIGLCDPSCHSIDDQSLLFGPAGNLMDNPEIIITGISTSITAASSIARELKSYDIDNITNNDLRNIYLKNIYKGSMYKKFKKYWNNKSKGSRFANNFQDLFNIIEGKQINNISLNILVTQLTLHGIATYYDDKWHNRKSWSAPSTKVFKSKIANDLYDSFFVENILKKRFIQNDKAKLLFIMGADAFNEVKQTIKNYLKNDNSNIIILEKIDECFLLKDYDYMNNKYIIKVKHAAS